jgi:hypothetical protein
MSYIGASDLVFNNSDGIYGGGFNVQSIMMKSGISPIMTLNNIQNGGTTNKVSDIFGGLAVPAYVYHNNFQTGGSKYDYKSNENSDEDDVLDEDLHDKLLDLMRNQDNNIKQNKKKLTRKTNKNKNGVTKKNKNSK